MSFWRCRLRAILSTAMWKNRHLAHDFHSSAHVYDARRRPDECDNEVSTKMLPTGWTCKFKYSIRTCNNFVVSTTSRSNESAMEKRASEERSAKSLSPLSVAQLVSHGQKRLFIFGTSFSPPSLRTRATPTPTTPKCAPFASASPSILSLACLDFAQWNVWLADIHDTLLMEFSICAAHNIIIIIIAWYLFSIT